MTTTAGGHGASVETRWNDLEGRPSPVRILDIYRVRYGRGGTWYVMEHRNGRVEIYGRLTGVKAEERARAIAKDANEGAA